MEIERLDNPDAEEVLEEELKKIKDMPHSKLSTFMGASNILSYEVGGKNDDVGYDVEVESAWVDEPGGNLEVHVALFEKSWRVALPLTATFIITPDDSIIEETRG